MPVIVLLANIRRIHWRSSGYPPRLIYGAVKRGNFLNNSRDEAVISVSVSSSCRQMTSLTYWSAVPICAEPTVLSSSIGLLSTASQIFSAKGTKWVCSGSFLFRSSKVRLFARFPRISSRIALRTGAGKNANRPTLRFPKTVYLQMQNLTANRLVKKSTHFLTELHDFW